MRSDDSSSDGFGGMRPAEMTNRFGSAVFCTASRTRAWPTSRCDRPISFCAPTTVCRPGRRMSASTSRTRGAAERQHHAEVARRRGLALERLAARDGDDARAVRGRS